jgi:hypothetical protein
LSEVQAVNITTGTRIIRKVGIQIRIAQSFRLGIQ